GRRHLGRVGQQRALRLGRTERAAVVHERHRDEVMPEDRRSHAHEREHTHQGAPCVARGEIDPLVPEQLLDQRSPAVQVEMRPTGLCANEVVPLRRRSGERADARLMPQRSARGQAFTLPCTSSAMSVTVLKYVTLASCAWISIPYCSSSAATSFTVASESR